MKPDKPNAVLSAQSITKSFPTPQGPLIVLREIDLEVQPGDTISIRGESGSGKSTLLHVLSALESWNAGTLHWEGNELLDFRQAKVPALRARIIGMVFQAYYLIPELNVLENVLVPARVAGKLDRAVRDRARDLLATVGLSDRQRSRVTHLSGGEKQRVAVARALINQPRLILADEPTGNLDEKTADPVMELLLSLCRQTQTALVLVTHNPEYAACVDRPLRLHDGVLTPSTVAV